MALKEKTTARQQLLSNNWRWRRRRSLDFVINQLNYLISLHSLDLLTQTHILPAERFFFPLALTMVTPLAAAFGSFEARGGDRHKYARDQKARRKRKEEWDDSLENCQVGHYFTS